MKNFLYALMSLGILVAVSLGLGAQVEKWAEKVISSAQLPYVLPGHEVGGLAIHCAGEELILENRDKEEILFTWSKGHEFSRVYNLKQDSTYGFSLPISHELSVYDSLGYLVEAEEIQCP